MSPLTRVAPMIAAILAVGAGCSHFSERRALSGFTEALEARNLAELKARSSEQFNQRALRRDEALDSLKMLRLPTADLEIVKVEPVSDDERLVTAEIGKSKRRASYRLVREEGRRKWVVDDVLLRHDRAQDGITAQKSVAEQVDLLLAVHEFLEAWNSGRADALDATTPEFRKVLADLPPVHLSRLTRRVVGEKPEAVRLTSPGVTNRNTGIVRVPRKAGALVVTLKQDESWKVADVAVESRADGEHVASVFKTAVAINAATDFLEAYRAADKQRLAGLCTESFYRRALLPGEIDAVPLPAGDVPQPEARIDMQPTSAEFLVPTERGVVKLSLRRMGDASDTDSAPQYRVDEVTIYESMAMGESPREMRLSVLFTGRAMLRLFAEALSRGDLPMLRKTSTADFNRRVWQQLDEHTLAELGPSVRLAGGMQIVDTKFQGAVTEVTVQQSGRLVTYVLRERGGDVRVDDVLISAPGMPPSLKETVELLLPVHRFATALSLSRIDTLQRLSSTDLNRHVWMHADRVPAAGFAAVEYLHAPLTMVRATGEDELLLVLGDEQFGARVLLLRENAGYVIDDMMLIAGPESRLQARLKRRLREELTFGATQREIEQRPAVEHAGVALDRSARNAAGRRHPGDGFHPETNRGVVPAGYHSPSGATRSYADGLSSHDALQGSDGYHTGALHRQSGGDQAQPDVAIDALSPPAPSSSAFETPGAIRGGTANNRMDSVHGEPPFRPRTLDHSRGF